jgi:23S rRNA (guanosine2251-2'-O)-methyltransferase
MAGNSQRRGAVRKAGTKKGPKVGSGGVRRGGLDGKGATPPAHMRPHHPKAKAAKRAAKSQHQRRQHKRTDDTELVLGRNPVLECLRADVPATALYIALGAEADERLTESVRRAADAGIAILEVSRQDLDRMSPNAMHQGIGLQVPPYQYAHPDDLLATATKDSKPALVVALDNISDPRNLGAIVRSVAGFGGHGVLIPQRRSASVTAVAWRTSAGAAARIPVARATNLTRTLKSWHDAGLQVIGLDADSDITLDEMEGTEPIVLVVGSEGKGLSRLVRENCDAVLSIPMAGPTESLNASVAAGVVLAEIARQRRG